MSIINIKNLTYRDLFSDLNLQINNPEFISLSGANNCGKTTLLRIDLMRCFLILSFGVARLNVALVML